MTNVTLSVDEESLKRARIHALELGTSLNAVIRAFLDDFVKDKDQYQQLTKQILIQAEESSANSQGVKWSREDLYER